MYCTKCGKKINGNSRFCTNCGTPISKVSNDTFEEDHGNNISVDDKTAEEILNNGSNDKGEADPPLPPDNNNNDDGGDEPPEPKKRKWFIAVLCLLIIAVGVFAVDYFDIFKVPVVDDILKRTGLKDLEYEDIEYPDAEDYYEENSEVINVIPVSESDDIQTENEIAAEMSERGFSIEAAYSEYSMEGEFSNPSYILETSDTEHPIYKEYFMTSNEEMWILYSINGQFAAYPVSYNMESTRNVPVMIAESNVLTSYDSETNSFYETIPNDTEMLVIVVEEINVAVLEEYNSEVLSAYEVQ